MPIRYANQDQWAAEVRGLAERCLQIDETWHDDGATILNSLIFLKALSLAKRFIAKESEVVIFARPDIEIDRGLRIVHYVRRCANSRSIGAPASLFPDWHSFGGLNDRFAISLREHIDRYFGRINRLDNIVLQNRPYHLERFLLEAYRRANFEKCIDTPMVRIRVGARPEQSDVELVRKRKWYRRHVKAFWKHKLLPALTPLRTFKRT